jgi:hypothetical protein
MHVNALEGCDRAFPLKPIGACKKVERLFNALR